MAYLLIVDDDEDLVAATTTVLEAAGHEVHAELDTAAGMASMEQRKPDLAILDVMFPENPSAGFELARKIRSHANEAIKKIPLLMLTAVNTKFPLGFGKGDIDESWLPVSDFLEKPVDIDVLQNKVAEMLENA